MKFMTVDEMEAMLNAPRSIVADDEDWSDILEGNPMVGGAEEVRRSGRLKSMMGVKGHVAPADPERENDNGRVRFEWGDFR